MPPACGTAAQEDYARCCRQICPQQRGPGKAHTGPSNAEASMADFYGIKPGAIPGFAHAGGGKFMSVESLPDQTVRHMVTFMRKLRGMYSDDPLAFEVCVRH